MQRLEQKREAKRESIREAIRYCEIKANLASTFKAKHNNKDLYYWSIIQNSKKYVRSSSNYNVFKDTLFVGIWNERKQIIEFVDELDKHTPELQNLLTKYNVRVE
jgi:hypothetical protein